MKENEGVGKSSEVLILFFLEKNIKNGPKEKLKKIVHKALILERRLCRKKDWFFALQMTL